MGFAGAALRHLACITCRCLLSTRARMRERLAADRIARDAFRRGNIFTLIRDEFGAIYTGEGFAALIPTRGQWAESASELLALRLCHDPELKRVLAKLGTKA